MDISQHDFKGLDDFFPAFMSGQQTDSKGQTKTWTNDELDEIVANTKKRIEDGNLFAGAPFVIGHPQTNHPAYGWTADVKRDGNTLLVKGDRYHDEFASGVEKGLWPNRSIRIGKDKNGFYLAHVGFLGAAPPAVTVGSESIYAADEAVYFDYEADTYTPNVLQRFMRGIRELVISKFDIATADQFIPGHDIESLNFHIQSLSDDDESTSLFSKHNTDQGDSNMGDFTQADIDRAIEEAAAEARASAEAEFSQKTKTAEDNARTERKARLTAEFSQQVTALVDKGTVTPAQAEGMSEFMLHLSEKDDAQFEFSAGEGDKKQDIKKSPVAWFNDFVASIGKQVDMGESDAGQADLAGASDFVSAHGEHVDADRLKLHNKALNYQAKHDGVDYVTAVQIVEQQEA